MTNKEMIKKLDEKLTALHEKVYSLETTNRILFKILFDSVPEAKDLAVDTMEALDSVDKGTTGEALQDSLQRILMQYSLSPEELRAQFHVVGKEES